MAQVENPIPSSTLIDDTQVPNQSRVMLALENVLSSATFSDMTRLKRFLEYVVTETVEGRGNRLKGTVIACDVFDKTDPDEAQSTTIVRVEAGRLRRRLNEYYQGEGKAETLRIGMPKGHYVVVFEKASEDSVKPDKQPGSQGKGLEWLTVRNSVLVITVIVCLVFIWNRYFTDPERLATVQSASVLDSKPIIAVLPFRNLASNDPDGSIAYGLTEDIITDLSGLTTLEVISMTSVLPFEDLEVRPLDIGKKFKVHFVLKGSIRGSAPDLRVTAQLYDTTSGIQLWAKRFDRRMENELALQAELARQVADSLAVRLQGDENYFPNHRLNTSIETWSLFKQAMNLVNPPSDPARLRLSLQAFKQISQRDPDFAGGFAGMAYVHAFKAFFGHSQSTTLDVQATLDMSEIALKLDPSFGLGHCARAFAFLVNRDFEQALTASSKAIQLAPNDPYLMTYHGFILSASGQSEEGIAYVETALRLDPLNVRTPYLNILGVVNFQAGHYEAALRAFSRNQERGGPLGPGTQYFVAAAYATLGDSSKAADAIKMADLLKNESYDWADWVKRSWKHQKDSLHIMNLVEQARQSGA